MPCRLTLGFSLLLISFVSLAPAQEAKQPPLKDTFSETKGVLKTAAGEIQYTTTAGTLILKEEDGTSLASMFFVAYSKINADPSKRPLTFAFNGGPGSSSVWLHMGAFGPKKVKLDDDGNPLPPPFKLVDNAFTLLDFTDLVFIDPVSTGFSRPAPGVPNSKFHGVQQDLDCIADFIRLYTSRFERWQSPRFVAGESYGGTRACALASLLQEKHNLYLNGIMLVSPAINFQTIRFDEGNELPFIVYLPAYTATAWYHKCLAKEYQGDLKQTIAESNRFAENEYASALMKGDRLPAAEKKAIASKVAQLTGLSEKYVLQTNLRIHIQRFCVELLRDQRRTVGRLDSRFTGHNKDAAGEAFDYDPASAAHSGAFAATVNQYLSDDLKFKTDLSYELLTKKVQPWDYSSVKNMYLNVAPMLRSAMTKNRDMKVFVANGYYDLATPFCATDYSIDHLGIEPALLSNITTHYYESGHMMYVHKASHEQLYKDLAKFYQSAVREQIDVDLGNVAMPFRIVVNCCLFIVISGALAPVYEAEGPPLQEYLSETSGSVTTAGGKIDYQAKAGTLVLKDAKGRQLASMFFVSYTKNDVTNLARRPITFAFNGGPGASSAWLHLRAFGPRKVLNDDDGNPLPPPFKPVDNEYSLLDFTDLVYIDPVTTGFSRPASGVPDRNFHGVQQDLDTVGDFINLYLSRFKRRQSPCFIGGESYGGTRACGLAGLLQEKYKLSLNGVLLISPAIDFQTLHFNERNDLPYMVYLPTYTATAWFHKRLSEERQRDLGQSVAEVTLFAKGQYITALGTWHRLTESKKKETADKVAALIGLSEKCVREANLRVHPDDFRRELLRDQGKSVGRLDGRFTDGSPKGAFADAVNRYLRHDLKVQGDLTYELMNTRVRPWQYSTSDTSYLNVARVLRDAMLKNTSLRVFVASGYFDFATPFAATDYTFDRCIDLDPDFEPELLANITRRYYEAGHMMYMHKASHEQLYKDLAKFYQSAVR